MLTRLFQINHVILKNQSVSTLAYHLIMIFEFLQVLFFVFYKVDIYNEFTVTPNDYFRIDFYFSFINF